MKSPWKKNRKFCLSAKLSMLEKNKLIYRHERLGYKNCILNPWFKKYEGTKKYILGDDFQRQYVVGFQKKSEMCTLVQGWSYKEKIPNDPKHRWIYMDIIDDVK